MRKDDKQFILRILFTILWLVVFWAGLLLLGADIGLVFLLTIFGLDLAAVGLGVMTEKIFFPVKCGFCDQPLKAKNGICQKCGISV